MPTASGPIPLQPAPTTTVSVQSLGSGSSGNAFLIEYGQASLLLDCGVGIRTISRALQQRQRRLADLDGILITHEHSDHIRTLPCLAGLDVPIVATAGTQRYLPLPDAQWQSIRASTSVAIAGMTVWAVRVDHDAAEPCGYLIEAGSTRVSIFTDLGRWDERLAEPIGASDLVVLEANHDEEMLRRGPYPIYLKRRVASAKGHLSNIECGTSLADTLRHAPGAPDIWLAHLSNTNNTPGVAHDTVTRALHCADLGLPVTALPRTTPGPVWRRDAGPGEEAWQPSRPVTVVSQLGLDIGG
jgi:phosphoribosyl 1,2-cyclic phosphodiesterase